MGLNISHDAFSGAYSSFNRFRWFVMKSIGGSWPPHEDESLDRNMFYWPEGFVEEDHPGLCEFFRHSDCDGDIGVKMCRLVANELEAILPQIEKLEQSHEAFGHIARDGGYAAVTRKFIDGCRLANKKRQKLRFD